MTFSEWVNKHPIGSTIKIKYENRISLAQITEYEYINNRLFMHAGIHTISLNDECNNIGVYFDNEAYICFPNVTVSEYDF